MKHLSPEQISNWVLGDFTEEEQEHARECVQCRGQFAGLHETLSLFRDSANHLSEREHQGRIPERWSHQVKPHSWAARPLRLALIAGSLVVVAAVPVYRELQSRQREAKAREDAILMEQVNDQVSRMVPAPMEPWLELLSKAYIEENGGHQ